MKIKYVISILVLSFAMFFYSSNIKAIEGSLGKISQIGDPMRDDCGTSDCYGMALKYSSDVGMPVLCTHYSKTTPAEYGGQTCTLTDAWNQKVRYGVAAIINASKNSIKSDAITDDYFSAELAINHFLAEVSAGGQKIGVLTDDNKKKKFNEYFTVGKEAYDNFDEVKKISISLSKSQLNFELVGDNYVSNEITVSGGTFKSATTTLGKVEKTGSKFKIVIPASSVTKKTDIEVEVKVTKELENSQAREYHCGELSDDTYQTVTPLKTESLTIEATKKLTSSIEPLGKLTINKYDNKNVALSGVTLKVTGTKGYNKTFVTNGNPIVINELDLDTYTIEEVSAPAGYIKASSQTVTLSKSKLEATVNIVNDVTKISVYKFDYDKKSKLKGAILKLSDKDGNILDTCRDERDKKVLCKWITTEDAYTIEGLPAGTYYLIEESAPKGYNIKKEKVKVEISEDGKVTVDGKVAENGIINFYNSLTRVEISKVSTSTGKELKGATLQILNEREEEMPCKILDSDGKEKLLNKCKWVSGDKETIVIGLVEGTYYLVEKIAPEGYELNQEKIKFEIKADGTTTKVEMKNNLVVKVPDTLSSRSALLIAISMFDIALGIGIVTYVKKNKVKE